MFLSGLTEEPVIKKNSFDYFTYISSEVKELHVERWGKVLHYHYNDTDGTKSQMESVILAIKQEPDKIVEAIENYFLKKQFKVIKKETQSVDLKKDNKYVFIYYHYDQEIDFYTLKIIFMN